MKGFILKVKFYIMRTISNRYIRELIADSVAKKIGKIDLHQEPSILVDKSSGDNHLENILKNGYTELNLLLPDEIIRTILSFSKTLKCFDPYNKSYGDFMIEDVEIDTHVANYRREDLIRCKPIMDLANDSAILDIVQSFLKAKPTISNINMWWSMGERNQAKDAQLFHRDVDDFRFLKLFIYLTDVSAYNGPHTFVEGSSSSSKLLKIRRYEDNEIIDVFGKDKIIEFIRPKGSAFIVNTYGFHKGLLPLQGNRLLLQIQYSLNPIGIENYQPIKIDNDNYDSYINRCLIKK